MRMATWMINKKLKEEFYGRMKKYLTWASYIGFPLIYVLYNETIFSLFNVNTVTGYVVLNSVIIGFMLIFLAGIGKKGGQHFVVEAVILCLITGIYLSQFIYYQIFQMLYVVSSIQGAGNAIGQFYSVLFLTMRENWLPIVLMILPLVYLFTIQRKIFKTINMKKKTVFSFGGLFVAFMTLNVAAVSLNNSGAVSPRMLFYNTFVPTESLEHFGVVGAMMLDVKFNVLNIKSDNFRVSASDITIEDKEPVKSALEEETRTVEETQVVEETGNIVYEPNILDIVFPDNGEDNVFSGMNEYFENVQPTMKNEYTGMFEGKNLILITAEGFSKFVVDEEMTPTLYKLFNEGFVFNNFYTPIWGVSTSDGEFVATTGLIPKAGVWSYTEIADNDMPFAFGRQFSNLGYVTKAYHNHSYTYYNRDRSYPNMGYEYVGVGNGMDITDQWPESDVEMMEVTVPDYAESSPFHVYYLTVSGHLEYNFNGNSMAYKHLKEVEHLNYSEAVQAYIACQLELEAAMASLLEQLAASGQLENTVIALSADHYPYGLTWEEYSELAGYDLEQNFEMYRNGFALWCKDMETPVYVDKVCSSLDIAPTLSNLFGLEYDSRLYMGKDILSDAEPLVVFQNRSFINGKIQYNSSTGVATKLTDEELTSEYIVECIQEVNDMFTQSANIIDYDYYRYLFGGH